MTVAQQNPTRSVSRPARVVMAAAILTLVGLALVVLAVPAILSGLSADPQGPDGLDAPAMTVAAGAVDAGAGLLLVLAGIGYWLRRTWGWWLAVLILAVGMAAALLRALRALLELNDRSGPNLQDVAIFGATAVLFGAGLWAILSARAWFRPGSQS